MITTEQILKAPFPWFGGKSRAADLIWPRLGAVPNYVEPFAGSLAVLLRRPSSPGNEIVNDIDCYVANAWRAMKLAPAEVAAFCDWPVNEADLHARHRWLHGRAEFRTRMEHEPDFFDARIAGYWIWGLSCWIGDNFCRPNKQLSLPHLSGGQGVSRQVPHLTGGKGVSRQVPHLTGGQGGESPSAAFDGRSRRLAQRSLQTATDESIAVPHKRPNMDRRAGRGCNSLKGIARKIPRLRTGGGGAQIESGPNKSELQTENLISWFDALANRLRHVKVCCGDWQRVCTKAATFGQGLTGVLLDPPYDVAAGLKNVYGEFGGGTISAECREWAIEHGKNPLMRIAFCGYEGEHQMPDDWDCVAWKASGGYASAAGNNENSARERIWFSPHCLNPEPELFA